MLYQEATCRVCGKPITAFQRTVFCSRACALAAGREYARHQHWRKLHGSEPYPYPAYQPIPKTCPICGMPTRKRGARALYCKGWCSKVASSNRMARYYQRHRDDILAKDRAKNAARKEAARV